MADYNVGARIPPQQPGWASVMSNVRRVPREVVLYRVEGIERAGERAM